mmetsp:Transcript_52562/g.152803  ORF Transcript_52562/g.152803 Transcript_52562/m.152803 type:complete len:216 (-) Transcript_52562:643-1290(-)
MPVEPNMPFLRLLVALNGEPERDFSEPPSGPLRVLLYVPVMVLLLLVVRSRDEEDAKSAPLRTFRRINCPTTWNLVRFFFPRRPGGLLACGEVTFCELLRFDCWSMLNCVRRFFLRSLPGELESLDSSPLRFKVWCGFREESCFLTERSPFFFIPFMLGSVKGSPRGASNSFCSSWASACVMTGPRDSITASCMICDAMPFSPGSGKPSVIGNPL